LIPCRPQLTYEPDDTGRKRLSETTNGGNQPPDPDLGRGQNPDQDQIQDQPAGSVFNDPIAPVWADPTASISPPPAPPGAAHPQDQQSAASQATPLAAPPMSNPYAQQPPAQPYGQQYPAYGQQYPAYGQQPYGTGPPAETNASAIVLTIVSGLLMLSTCFLIGIPSLVFGIIALTSNTMDPVGSRKKAKIGWIIFAVNAGLAILVPLAFLAIAYLTSNGDLSGPPNNF
jgi:hypothetical protein